MRKADDLPCAVVMLLQYAVSIVCAVAAGLLVKHYQRVEGQEVLWGLARSAQYEWRCIELPSEVGLGTLLLTTAAGAVYSLSRRHPGLAILILANFGIAFLLLLGLIWPEAGVVYP
ncbi:MAG TPA: hypothetical protein VK797_17330 [Tepidisphaeraceae bacterium]|nr:hypothetical protein [Tepidisphaeraceae bacterium]